MFSMLREAKLKESFCYFLFHQEIFCSFCVFRGFFHEKRMRNEEFEAQVVCVAKHVVGVGEWI
jgi:hypothetical protein